MKPAREQANEPTRKGSGKEEITVSEEERAATMRAIFGPSGGVEYRDDPWTLMRQAVNHATFTNVALIVKLLRVQLQRGNVAVIKLLFDFLDCLAKRGTMQPEAMQSFADLLIQSLEAETPVEMEPCDAERIVEAGK